jgi:hypothetical protein
MQNRFNRLLIYETLITTGMFLNLSVGLRGGKIAHLRCFVTYKVISKALK